MRELLEPYRAGAPTPASVSKPRWTRSLLGLGLLIAAYVCVDRVGHGELQARFAHLRLGYVWLGMLIAVPQLACLAFRWRFTAARLGVQLTPRAAFHEYSLSLLLNQLSPWGVLGDALRVVRQGRQTQRVRPEHPWQLSLHTVVVERGIGQCVVIAWALAAAPLWLGTSTLSFVGALSLAALGLGSAVYFVSRRPLTAAGGVVAALQRLCVAFVRALGSRRALLVQVLVSSAITLSLLAQLYCALAALGSTLPLRAALQIFPFMLLSMTVPFSVAGFGPREAATAALYRAAHLSEAEGLAVAVAYGALTLSAAVPWALCWLLSAPSASEEP